MRLRIADNLTAETLESGEPWAFESSDLPEMAERLSKLNKDARRAVLLQKGSKWQVYSVYEGHAPNLRIRKDNPARQMHALTIDYDRKHGVEQVLAALEDKQKSFKGDKGVSLMPNYIEITLSGNIRLVWLFERPVNLCSPEFADDFYDLLIERLRVTDILLGYDDNSKKPEQLWTNGGTWYDLDNPFLSWKWLLGIQSEVLKRAKYEGKRTIPLEIVKAEVDKQYPGAWLGEFKLDETGRRFWDKNADNPSGCQIKMDGMVCFTGPFPFRSWGDILGAEWAKLNTELNDGMLIEPFYYNTADQNFHELENGIWQVRDKESVQRRLRVAGASSKIPKGETCSEVDRLVTTIEKSQHIFGVGPLVTMPPGRVIYKGKPWINTADIQCIKAVKGPTGTEADFPFIWHVLQGFKTGHLALETFLAWWKRFYVSQRDHQREMGQSLFLMGEADCGKTLVFTHAVTASVGGKHSNPYDYFTGKTTFNVELFAAPVLMVNDEESPESVRERRALHAKVKSCSVNPSQTVHPKFRTPIIVDWCGRMIWSLNDDPGDTIQLPEVVNSNRDKIMFFRMVRAAGLVWPSRATIENAFARELPSALWWLENAFQPPTEIILNGRMGVKSYFDEKMVRLSLQNTDAYAILELLAQWIKVDDHFFDDKAKATQEDVWAGTSSELLTRMHAHDTLKPLLQGVNAKNLPKSLETLSKQRGSGISIDPDSRRRFIIDRHVYHGDE